MDGLAYATWDPRIATDDPDGLPDTAIVPLVEDLRRAGITTLQSCAGHIEHRDGTEIMHAGCLWLAADAVDQAAMTRLCVEPFEDVSRVYWPVERWQVVWPPRETGRALVLLRRALLTS
jgi:hypothetical protein